MTEQVERAKYGEVIHTRPSPEEYEDAGERIRTLRHNLGILRSEAQQLNAGWAPNPGDTKTYRDVEGLLTAAIVLLAEPERSFPKWAEEKREKLAHPEKYVIEEGFWTERYENALVRVWWWDGYHQEWGPDFSPMPWREPRPGGKNWRR